MHPVIIDDINRLTEYKLSQLISLAIYPPPENFKGIEMFATKRCWIYPKTKPSGDLSVALVHEPSAPFTLPMVLVHEDKEFIISILKNFKTLTLRSSESAWQKFKQAWDSHPEKPDWDYVLHTMDGDEERARRLTCHTEHSKIISEKIRNGEMRTVTSHFAPSGPARIFTWIHPQDALDYIDSCGLDSTVREGGRSIHRSAINKDNHSTTGTDNHGSIDSEGKSKHGTRDVLYLAILQACKELGSNASGPAVWSKMEEYASEKLHNIHSIGESKDPNKTDICVHFKDADGKIKDVERKNFLARVGRLKTMMRKKLQKKL